ncbi:5010_t:CDS:2 [Diversispora eburnea]|uniref:5010_t:CDS:1 n=1 Tax=Diversispora eburnea TaxID=1213867 RepID=A0A9N9CYE4_9GLOM|nr:5010_t:CDS:2 [Diversispora eburnea]
MFEFFWRLFDSKQLEYFEGKFINPRQPKIEQVVRTHLTLAANQISKSIGTKLRELAETAEEIKNQAREDRNNCTETIENGLEQIRLIAADAYGKNSKRQKERLALKGKSIEQAQKDNEKAQKEIDEMKKNYEENENKIRDLEKKAQEAKAKGYEDEIFTLRNNGKNISETIKTLTKRIKDNNSVISGTLSNLNDSH